jgi:hypothetical protein
MNNEPANPVVAETGKMPEPPAPAGGEAGAGPARDRRRRKKNRRLSPSQDSRMIGIFWSLVVLMLVYLVLTWPDRPAAYSFAALLVAFFALLPAYLWCSGAIPGLPIFPFFAGSFLLTHGLQFALAEPKLREHSMDSVWRATWTVCGFLLLATAVWFFWVKRPHSLPPACRVLAAKRGTDFLLLILAASTMETLFDQAGWLDSLPGGLTTLVRNFFRGPTAFAVFVLAFRWGSRFLRPGHIILFIGLFIANCLVSASSIFLVSTVIMSIMLVLGFTIGRKTVPLLWTVSLMAVVGLLHVGKSDMRSRYWEEGMQGNTLQPWSYPSFYADWFSTSLKRMVSPKQSNEEEQTIFSRVNTVFLLLQAQEMAPGEVPFLDGATYAIIPNALIPRLFNSGKVSPVYGNSLLNVTFGNQTWEETQSTTIGWGMLNEAYANFGYTGCFALALILAGFYGAMTRWGIGMPPTSLPALIGIFTLSFAIETEMTAAVYITAYLQSLFALLVLVFPFTERISLLSGAEIQQPRPVAGGQ